MNNSLRGAEEKTCCACKKSKPLSEFYKLPSKKRGVQYKCSECSRIYMRNYVANAKYRVKRVKQENVTERTCVRCQKTLPLHLMAKNPTCIGGRRQVCLACDAADTRRRHHENPARAYARTEPYRKSEQGKKNAYKAHLAQRKKFPEKFKARAAVRYAVVTGRLIKPTLCPNCDKAGRIEGHHPDYSKPLDIKWFCSTCHKAEHGYLGNHVKSILKGEEK
jgi:hypothetical protein